MKAWAETRCRSCGAPVIWAVSAYGRKLPVDAHPAEAGQWWLTTDDPRATVPNFRRVDLYTPAAAPRYTSHFATCPQADKWRKGK
jgi:hypothetical protein